MMAAETALKRAPSMSVAYLVQANILSIPATATGIDGPNRQHRAAEALVLSEAMAPDLLWMAARRTMIALPIFETLPTSARAALARDIGRSLMNGGERVSFVVRQYQAYPDAQEFIVEIVESLPVREQRRFLSVLQLES